MVLIKELWKKLNDVQSHLWTSDEVLEGIKGQEYARRILSKTTDDLKRIEASIIDLPWWEKDEVPDLREEIGKAWGQVLVVKTSIDC